MRLFLELFIFLDLFRLARKDDVRPGRGALMILCMLANADPSLIRSNLALVVQGGFGERALRDPSLARWASIALQKLTAARVASASATQGAKDNRPASTPSKRDPNAAVCYSNSPFAILGAYDMQAERFKASHVVFEKLAEFLRTSEISAAQWFPGTLH